ncbi:aminotransferase class V-fold PLP-dependent enzyme [Yinghuangia aomiensis]|uniref:Aminotransferase class V-fold PLP-dependent enzyme n=1 Tax=Yinghuangia aomiensis TaxID=676205 RepID=A0ABP9IDQ7_9ACTN
MTGPMAPDQFRALFPALSGRVWLDTPASPPGALPVTNALTEAINAWQAGQLDASGWESAAPATRIGFARYLGVPEADVALMGSVAEAAATVAASLPPARRTIVVGDDEFRSNLFPWLALRDKGYRILEVPTAPHGRTESLLAAIDGTTALVAVSHVLSIDGERIDLARVRSATDAVGARLFVDATQSLGVLRPDLGTVRPDYLAVHGYKWMLCPRGAAWLVTPHHDELQPLLPSWKSTADGAYFGGRLHPAAGAARCDTSPAWLSWVGAAAAVRLVSSLPAETVEQHCLALADSFRQGAEAAGASSVGTGQPSHIVTVQVSDPSGLSDRLRSHRVQALVNRDRLRVGFHFFNNDDDVAVALRALAG